MRISQLLFMLLCTITCIAQRSDFQEIDFTKADSIALKYKGASLKNIPVLTHNLTSSLQTDVEKIRAIYTWIGTNIENDYSSYLKISHKRKRLAKDRQAFLDWNTGITPKIFKALLEHKKTACTGYAYLVKEMTNLAGFECDIIDGYGRTPTLLLDEDSSPNHSWNRIKVNNKWYWCDATWSAGETIILNGEPMFNPDYFDGYFFAEPELFSKNHFPINTAKQNTINTETFKSFINAPVVYKEAFIEPIISIAPKNMHNQITKGTSVSFKLKVPDDFNENIHLLLNKGGGQKVIEPTITKEEREIILQHTFDKKGSYDVHISTKDYLVATYVIKVK
ncbi:transglutaminase domain-containing protein [Maribacter dokdonensis]|uniref:transglutaminase domain-containing protein n=2 Tax=Maribacter dokdonensis TaxID=320912 RepID=UPI00328A4BC7